VLIQIVLCLLFLRNGSSTYREVNASKAVSMGGIAKPESAKGADKPALASCLKVNGILMPEVEAAADLPPGRLDGVIRRLSTD
jgi:hypothetical protein